MDPLAHTLAGATLAETGLRRSSRLATPALLIGANLPDVDGIASLMEPDVMYAFRRGWTHGVLAVVVLPWVLWGGLLLYAHLRPDARDGPPLRPWRLLAIAYLGVLTHPLLDWLNNYGVRLLMPFDDSWHYGDALFIVDPWMWLSMASAVVLARTSHRLAIAGWLVLAVLASAAVLGSGAVPLTGCVVWVVAVLAIAIARLSEAARSRAHAVARGALVFLALHIAVNLAITALAREEGRRWAVAQGMKVERVVAGPIAANPLKRDVIVLAGGHYTFVWVTFLGPERVVRGHAPIAVNDSPQARRALAAPGIEGYAHWLRLPAFELEPTAAGTRVWVRDVRYSRMRAGIGRAYVEFDLAGQPTQTWVNH